MWLVHLALLTVALIYGGNYTIAKSLMHGLFPPFALILMRIGGAFIVFISIHSLFIKEKISSRSDYLCLLICAIFGVATNMLCFFKGLSMTSPVNASIIMTINPILVLTFSALWLSEALGKWKILGIILGMIGAISQVLDPFGIAKEVDGINWKGDLLVLCNASCYAVYLVAVKPLMKKYNALTVLKWTFMFGLILVLPFGLSEWSEINWSAMKTSNWFQLSYVVLATTCLVYLLNAWALRHVSSSVVGSYIYLQPLLATLFAVLLAGYETSVYILIYASFIFLGVYFVSKKTTPTKLNPADA